VGFFTSKRRSLLIAGVLIGLGGLSGSLSGCSSLAYQPSNTIYADPSRANVRFESLDFQSKDGTRLHGWFFPVSSAWKGPAKGTIIQFHGNAENMTSHFASLFWVIDAGYNFFTFDYRGYGGSDGSPSQKGLNEDANAAVEFIAKKVARTGSSKDLVLYGQSLGGAVLMRAYRDIRANEALHDRVRALVIESSFYSYKAIGRSLLARTWLTFLFQPLAYVLVSDEFSPEDDIAKISPTPLLVIHGQEDPVIPFSFGENIFKRAKEPKTFWKIEQGHHIDTMSRHQGAYREKLIQFLDSLP
jgi:fermentation-respiration switch protein FrsA (DUF1100 family)